jgi:hypothetical protein
VWDPEFKPQTSLHPAPEKKNGNASR